MKTVCLVLSLICFSAAVAYAVPQHDKAGDTSFVPTYELYSWKTSSESWNFCLLYTTDRQKSVEEVLKNKTALRGLEQLKRKISKLEKGARIVWFDRLTIAGDKIQGSEKLGYPPRQIMEDVKQYAATRRNIKVVQ